ncbi:hypothetical protein [Neorhizobium galegae]|uniref:hypothetical protein n=1 Tax=Neorhizobium galegae TaxID=399 RepID=UPI002106FB7C|nr:hypothetical protein [Neorhizobium galegae]MCQ1855277.1 hypothetical protein [Neorhizobium galegae]
MAGFEASGECSAGAGAEGDLLAAHVATFRQWAVLLNTQPFLHSRDNGLQHQGDGSIDEGGRSEVCGWGAHFKLRNEMAAKLGVRVNFMKVFGRTLLILLSFFLMYYSSQTMTYLLSMLTYYLLLKFLDYSDRASNSNRIPNGYKIFNLLIDWIWNGFRTRE